MGTMSRLSMVKPARQSRENMSSSNSNSKDSGKEQSTKESMRLEEESCKALALATIPIEARLRNGERLWDQDFSSMSSYGSQDLEVLNKIVQQSESTSYNSESERSISVTRTVSSSSSSANVSHPCTSNSEQSREGELSQKRKEYTKLRRQRSVESLSAELPEDVGGPAKDSIPLVMQSCDPYGDFRESIRQMVVENGIYEWEQLQELLYCYIKLNSPELYHSITSAFVDVLVEIQSESWSFESDECLDYDWP